MKDHNTPAKKPLKRWQIVLFYLLIALTIACFAMAIVMTVAEFLPAQALGSGRYVFFNGISGLWLLLIIFSILPMGYVCRRLPQKLLAALALIYPLSMLALMFAFQDDANNAYVDYYNAQHGTDYHYCRAFYRPGSRSGEEERLYTASAEDCERFKTTAFGRQRHYNAALVDEIKRLNAQQPLVGQ